MIKKAFLAVLLIIITACSNDSLESGNDDNGNGLQQELKIKNITEEIYYEATPVIRQSDFVYENDKLISIVDPIANTEMIFVYANEYVLLVYMNENNQLINIKSINYEDTEVKRITDALGKIDVNYTYQNGALKTRKELQLRNDAWEVDSNKEFTFDQNGNAIEILSSSVYSPTVSKSKHIHDNKKNPFSGMNPYLKYLLSFESFNVLDQNNVVTQEQYNDVSGTTVTETITYHIQYNTAGYPTEIQKISNTNNRLLSKAVILYN